MSKKFPKRRTQSASQSNRSELVDLLSNIEERVLDLESLRLDGGTQPRERLDDETLEEYVTRMQAGEDAQRRTRVLDPDGQPWPSLVVFQDGDTYWLADGFHRAEAAQRAGITQFQARVHRGTQRDAIKHSLGVNATHGKRRTNEDKRRAVERAADAPGGAVVRIGVDLGGTKIEAIALEGHPESAAAALLGGAWAPHWIFNENPRKIMFFRFSRGPPWMYSTFMGSKCFLTSLGMLRNVFAALRVLVLSLDHKNQSEFARTSPTKA